MHPATVLVIHPWSFLRILKDILLRLHAVYLCYLASNSPPPLIRKLWAVAELNRLTLTRLLLNKLLCGALDLSRIVCMSTSFTSHYHKLLASQASPMPINCARLSGLSSRLNPELIIRLHFFDALRICCICAASGSRIPPPGESFPIRLTNTTPILRARPAPTLNRDALNYL